MLKEHKTGKIGVTLLACGVVSALALPGCTALYPPLDTVDSVDLDRYLGKWYEIARYPNSFERGCVGVTAEYALLDNGQVEVVNTCVESSLDGPVRTIEGTARVFDSSTNAKLKVTFFWPFEGDYWILDLGEEYDYAVVGAPNREFLWILNRTPTMDDALYDELVAKLPDLGFDPDRLYVVPQVEEE